jgi:hypothetical protein
VPDDVSAPLTCDGRTHRARVVAGGDFPPTPACPGAARVEAAFCNDELGHWHEPTGFGPKLTGTVVLAEDGLSELYSLRIPSGEITCTPTLTSGCFFVRSGRAGRRVKRLCHRPTSPTFQA